MSFNPRRSRQRSVSRVLGLGLCAALCFPVCVNAQMTLPTKGKLTAEMPKTSLVLGNNLAALRAWWAKPADEHQKAWRDSTAGRADQTPSATAPTKFGEAAAASSIAKAAALRWAMDSSGPKAQADLAKVIAALKVATVPGGTTITRPEALLSYLLAYDFIRSATIPAADRTLIEENLLREASSIKTGHTDSNAKGKIGGTRGLAGILLHDQTLLDQALLDLNNHFKYSTTDDGWFCDSMGHYLNYTINHLAAFARAYQQAGVDIYPNLRPYSDMAIGLRMPSGTMPNVSNGTLSPVAINLFSFTTDRDLASEEVWAATTVPAGDFSAKTNVMNNDSTYTNFFALTNRAADPKPPMRSPTFLTRGQSGVSVFRNDWSATSNYLLLSPGVDSPTSNQPLYQANPPATGIMPAYHSQNDTGEVLIASRGVSILCAAGYDRRDLSNSPKTMDPKRAEWHNVLLVDGDVGKLPGPSMSVKHPENETTIEWGGSNLGRAIRPGDFTHTDRLDSAELGKFKGVCDFATLKLKYNDTDVRRSVAFPNEDYFVVADIARSASPHKYTVNFVGRGGAPVVEKAARSVTARWEKDKASAIVTTLGSCDLTQSSGQHWMQETYNKFEDIFRSQATGEASNACFLTVIECGETGAKPALTVTNLQGGDFIAATIANSKAGAEAWVDTILSQPKNELILADKLRTDASFAYLRVKGDVVQGFMVSHGTNLAVLDKMRFGASKPITISVLPGEREIRATISSDDLTPGTKVSIATGKTATGAKLDGKAVPFSMGVGLVSVEVSAGGSLVIEVGQ